MKKMNLKEQRIYLNEALRTFMKHKSFDGVANAVIWLELAVMNLGEVPRSKETLRLSFRELEEFDGDVDLLLGEAERVLNKNTQLAA